jgi:hypothetical protein
MGEIMAQTPVQTKQEVLVKQPVEKGHTARNIGLVIIAIVVIGGCYFYYEYLSGGIGGAVYAAITSGNPAQSIQNSAFQKLNSTPQFTLSYQGTITENVTVNNTDPVMSFPFYLSYQKYYSTSRVSASFSGLPGLANESVVLIYENITGNSTVYACLNLGGTGFKCTESSGDAGQIEQNLSNYFGLSNLGNVKVGTPIPSYYNGMPCFSVQGTGTVYGRTRLLRNSGNASISFSACFSSNYYVPLVLNASAVSPGMSPVALHVAVTNITEASNYTAITSLPGPLGNSTV